MQSRLLDNLLLCWWRRYTVPAQSISQSSCNMGIYIKS